MQEQEKKTTGRGRKAKTEETIPVENISQETAEKKAEAPSAVTFTEEQVRKMIAEAVAKYAQENTKEAAPYTDGMVTMVFQAEVNDQNEILLGPNGKYGMITGKHATITVPKRDFVGEFRTSTVQYLLKSRNLIVVDGLTDDERKVFGLEYRQGEYLEPAVYEGLIEMGDHILEIYPMLHPTWKEMVATKFIDAYENKTLKCSREALIQLNRLSKQDYASLPKDDVKRKGAFWPIIHAMNAADE